MAAAFVFSLVIGFGGSISVLAAGPAPVDLLSAGNFTVLSKSGITDTGSHSSVVVGIVGASPISGAAILVTCPEVTGTIYSADAAGPLPCRVTDATLLTSAANDMVTAYNNAAGAVTPAPVVELNAGNIGGLTIAPGIYKWSTGVNISTNVTLSGGANDVWIFQIAGDLNIASGGSVPAGIKVILAGGAQASNVFWQVGGPTGATLGTYSTFNGNILSAKQIIMQTGAVLNGRALAQTQVTLDANTVSAPVAAGQTCSDITLVSGTSTQFKGLTTTDPAGLSANSLFAAGTPGAAVVATPTGFPGAWDVAAADPDVAGANWVNDSVIMPTNPAGGDAGLDGTIDTWRLFSDSLTIPAGAVSISSPVLHFTSDNSVQAFLDDTSVGTALDHTTVTDSPPLAITAGAHTFKFVVKNDAYDGANNPTGLIYKVTVNYCMPVVPATVQVHFFKYIDGVKATEASVNGVSFPMFTSTYNAAFQLRPAGWYAGDLAYEASTSPMPVGSPYSANEDMSTGLVGTSCDGTHTYTLTGYSIGGTLADAAVAVPSLTAPNFANLQGDEYVIVQNHLCTVTTTLKVHILKYLDGAKAVMVPGNYQFPMTATWNSANIGAGTGNYVLGDNHGGAADLYGANTSAMQAPADYTTSEITSGTSQVVSLPELCVPGEYLLNGYRTSSTSFADAAVQPLLAAAPVFTALNSDQYVIVDNSSCPTKGSLTVNKISIGGNNTFSFTGDNGIGSFQITTASNAGYATFSNLAPGTYHVIEATKTGWTQTDSNCSAVTISAGHESTCTVTNTNNKLLGAILGTKFEDRDGDGKLKDGDHHKLAGVTIYIDKIQMVFLMRVIFRP